jgi:septal ring factor EnvC (AmiA/AmiB activator)
VAPYVPDNLAPETDSTDTMQNADMKELQNDLKTQLMAEREEHTVTKRLLQHEQQKVCRLNEELNELRRQAGTLIATHRLNAASLNKTIRTIEPKIDHLVKKADMLAVSNRVSDEKPSRGSEKSKTSEQAQRQQVNEWADLSPPVDLLGDLGRFPSLDGVLKYGSVPRLEASREMIRLPYSCCDRFVARG